MMAKDRNGNAVEFGDYLVVDAVPMGDGGATSFSGIVRVVVAP